MGVEGNADFGALSDVAGEVLDLVGVDVGGGHFDCGGEVEDDWVGFSRLPGGFNGFADADGEVETGVGEGFGGEFVGPFSPLCVWVVFGQGADELGALDCEFQGLVFSHAKDDSAEAFGGGEVEVDDCLLCTFQGLDCPLDEVFAAG